MEDIILTKFGTKTSILKVFRIRTKKTKDILGFPGGMIFFVVGPTPRTLKMLKRYLQRILLRN